MPEPIKLPSQRTVVISDLHLSPHNNLESFTDPEPLCQLLERQAGEGMPLSLVLLGDTFDFLKIEGYEEFSVSRAVERLFQITRCKRSAPAGQVMGALRHLVREGAQLHFLAGDHELELVLPAVQEALLRDLGAGEGQFFFYDGTRPLLWDDGKYQFYFNHGSNLDRCNRWNPALIKEASELEEKGRKAPVELPFGSRFILKIVNRFLPRYPLLDRLQPEISSVLPVLLYLDPAGVIRLLWEEFGVTVGAALAAAVPDRELLGEDVVIEKGERTPEQALMEELLAETFLKYEEASKSPPARFWTELKEFLAAPSLVERQEYARGKGIEEDVPAGFSLLRRIVKIGFGQGEFFDCSAPDDYVDLAARFARYNEATGVILGHSHGAKNISWNQDKDKPALPVHYLNTGTWRRLIPLKRYLKNDAAFLELFYQEDPGEVFPTWVELLPGKKPKLHNNT